MKTNSKLADSPTFVQTMMPYRSLFVIAGLIFTCTVLPAQPLTGIWKGYFITKDQSQYKIEVQIQERNGQVTGVTYSYLDVQFYGKATITGRFDKKEGKLSMQEIKTVEVKTLDSSETCIMNYQLAYSRSGNEEYLEGNYSSKYEFNGLDTKKGQDCGGGIVFLRRVSSSDFDTKPLALKTSPTAKKIFYNQAPPSKNQGSTRAAIADNKSTSAATKSQSKTTTASKAAIPNKGAIPNKATATNKSVVANKPITNPPQRTTTQNPQKTRTVYSTTSPTSRQVTTAPSSPKQPVEKSEVTAYNNIEINPTSTAERAEDIISAVAKHLPDPVENNRQNELVKEIVVSSKQISISVYDNGEIDGDTVSVYLNGSVVLSKKRLSTLPLQLKLTLDEEQDLQELTFVAENLGRIPPNTALMIVDTGLKQYRLQVLSTDKKNAVFRFRFQPSQ